MAARFGEHDLLLMSAHDRHIAHRSSLQTVELRPAIDDLDGEHYDAFFSKQPQAGRAARNA
jgi:hypothetical protein